MTGHWWRRWITRNDPELPPDVLAARAKEREAEDRGIECLIEVAEQAARDCPMCDDIGEPHICEREWWRHRAAFMGDPTWRHLCDSDDWPEWAALVSARSRP